MNQEEFIELFAEQFDETEIDEFSIDTAFRELEEWDSMVALMVIAMIDEEYNVKVSGDDIRYQMSESKDCLPRYRHFQRIT